MTRLVVLLALVLVGCGGPPPSPPGMQEAETTLRLARGDFARHRYAQAADAYADALEAAWRLDDPALLEAAGAERALALLRAGDARAALAAAVDVEAELLRRGRPPPSLLLLTAAAAELKLGRLDAAEATLARLDGTAPGVAERVAFLRGRIAAERGDRDGLSRVISGLPVAEPPSLAADRRELEARRLLLLGEYAAAREQFLDVAASRRRLDQLDAVGEALALAGGAAAALGDAGDAADLYLRAARNAWVLDRPDLADERLDAAQRQALTAGDPALTAAIETLGAEVAAALEA